MTGPETNLVLIGMPGVGKSTVGVLLAKATGRAFLDTDVWIQSREGRQLQAILDAEGRDTFCRIEERHILALSVRAHVIATGGSVVYSERAMRHLKGSGVVVHLWLPLEALARRIADMATRGLVIAKGQTLAGLYEERRPLYEAWADLAVDGRGKTQDEVAAEIVRALKVEG